VIKEKCSTTGVQVRRYLQRSWDTYTPEQPIGPGQGRPAGQLCHGRELCRDWPGRFCLPVIREVRTSDLVAQYICRPMAQQ
jgi:hypothetical protein